MVDWSGASVTPRGLSVTEETLERTEVSEAAHRTPPGKDAGGTEINPSPCKVAFSAVDIIFFNNMNRHAVKCMPVLLLILNDNIGCLNRAMNSNDKNHFDIG